MFNLIGFSLIGGLFSLFGGALVLWKKGFVEKHLTGLIAFAAGAFLGAVFLDLLPEALEFGGATELVFMFVLGGFTLFFTLERLIMKYFKGKDEKKSEHSEHTESLPFLLVLGDSFHNFLDGVAIGMVYLASPVLGLPTALAVAAHEIPQEIGDFAVLVKAGWSRKRVLAVNIWQSLLTVPGVFLGYYLGVSFEQFLPYFLAFASGTFLYIAASDLVPELHHNSSHKHFYRVILPFVGAIFAVYILKVFLGA